MSERAGQARPAVPPRRALSAACVAPQPSFLREWQIRRHVRSAKLITREESNSVSCGKGRGGEEGRGGRGGGATQLCNIALCPHIPMAISSPPPLSPCAARLFLLTSFIPPSCPEPRAPHYLNHAPIHCKEAGAFAGPKKARGLMPYVSTLPACFVID